MKTLADLKRRIKVGTTIRLTQHFLQGTKGFKLSLTESRQVTHVQGTAIVLGSSWLYWPKAKSVRITGPDTFQILNDTEDPCDERKIGEPLMTYQIVGDVK